MADNNRGIQYYLNNLNPLMVTAARELRGMTKKDLATSIDKSPSAITRIEKGTLRPDLETFFLLSRMLKIAPSFFSKKSNWANSVNLADCHFRSKRSTSLVLKRQAVQNGIRLLDSIQELEKAGVIFREETISSFHQSIESDLDIERLALQVREEWGLGEAPIPNLLRVLESNGIFVINMSGEEFEKVDAFSAWIEGRPCIFLCYNKPPSRIAFDLGHELGHLLMHEEIETGCVMTERQANRFASSFLLPLRPFTEECPRRWNLVAFKHLKKRWKTSIQAQLFRGKELGIISPSSYKRAMIKISSLGFRKEEPAEFDKEKPELLKQAINLVSNEITLQSLAEASGLYENELQQLLETQCVPKNIIEKIKHSSPAPRNNLVQLTPQ